MTNDGSPLACYVTILDEVIAEVAKGGFAETAALLKIARLDLVMRVYGISEHELHWALDVIEGNEEPEVTPKLKPPVRTRPRLVRTMGGP